MRYRVVTSSRSAGIGGGLTYESPEELSAGALVKVPLRGSTLEGIVIEKIEEASELFDVKAIASILTRIPILPFDVIALLPWMSETYFSNIRRLFRSILPAPPWTNLIAKDAQERDHEPISLIKKEVDTVIKIDIKKSLPMLIMGTRNERISAIVSALVHTVQETKDALLLAPDFATCDAWHQLLRSYIPDESIVQLAGATTAQERKACRRMHAREHLVTIGTRAAAFAPLQNLGLIVMDEEQEWTYKNRQTPYFSTREIVMERAKHAHAKLVFSSACPSLETWQRVQTGTIELHESPLDDRSNIRVIDLKEAAFGTSYPLTSPLIDAIQQRLDAKEQSVLLLNHRGVASGMVCTECGHRIESAVTGQPLTVHHDKNDRPFLWDHVTGTTSAVPETCPQCRSVKLFPVGTGTQRVESLLRKFFPSARIRRIDSETIDSKKHLIDIRTLMEKKEVDILIGTQPVVSLSSSPTVTLLASLVADIGLSAANIRASERTVGLLARMRSLNPAAEMIIQTFRPGSIEIRAVASGKLDEYLSGELALRARGGFPPFAHVISLLVRGMDAKNHALELRVQLEEQLKKNPGMIEAITLQPSFVTKNMWYVTLRGKHPEELVRRIDTRHIAIDVDPLDV